MSAPAVTVLMPVHDAVAHLDEAINSILGQSFQDFEFLVLNDASTEGARQAINAMVAAKQDPRLKLVDNGQNLGLIATLNRGMALARGRYIARMDADDVSHPSRFEKQVALMDSTAADVCGCHFLIVNESGKTIDSRIVPLVGDAFTVYLMVTAPFAHSSVMLRTAFFRHNALEYGGLRYAEDYDLWARAWEKGAIFAAVDEFVFTYRDHAISTQKRLGREYSADTKSIRRRFVTRNLEACERAVINLLDRYDQLTRLERIFLVWGAYAVSMRTNPSLILKVLGRSDRKSTVLALLSLAKGV